MSENAFSALAVDCLPAVKSLHVAWNEIGYSPETQAKLTKDIVAKLSEIFQDYVRSAQNYQQELSRKVEVLKVENAAMMRRLGEDASSTTNKPVSLQRHVDDLIALNKVLNEKIRTRMQTIEKSQTQYATLYQELYDQPAPALRGFEEHAATLALIGQYDMEIEKLATEKKRRVAQAAATSKMIVDLWVELDIVAQSEFEVAILRSEINKLITLEQLKRLELKLVQLTDQKRICQSRKQALLDEIQSLWDRLKVDADTRAAFHKSTVGLSSHVLQVCTEEIERLKELKKQHVAQFVHSCRQELRELWDQLYYSDEQQKQFIPAFVDVYNEESLSAHEREVALLKAKLSKWQPILLLVNEHKQKMKELAEFQEQSNDPNRLTSRSKRDPGRLLREEKFRKTTAKEIPKIEENLHDQLLLWEQEHGSPFTVGGQAYIHVLEEAMAERRKDPKASSVTPLKSPRHILAPSKSTNAILTPSKSSRPVVFNTPVKRGAEQANITAIPAKSSTWNTLQPQTPVTSDTDAAKKLRSSY